MQHNGSFLYSQKDNCIISFPLLKSNILLRKNCNIILDIVHCPSCTMGNSKIAFLQKLIHCHKTFRKSEFIYISSIKMALDQVHMFYTTEEIFSCSGGMVIMGAILVCT